MRAALALGGIALAAVGYGVKEYCEREGCFDTKPSVPKKERETKMEKLDRELEEFDTLFEVADEFGDMLDIIGKSFNGALDKIEDMLIENNSSDPEIEEKKERARKLLLEKSLEELLKGRIDPRS